MQHQSALISGSGGANTGGVQVVKSRFGDVEVDASKGVTFPRGLLGMPDRFNFVLTSFPSEKMQQFKMLQSLDDQALSFITLPVDVQNPIISQDDLKSAMIDLQIPEDQLVVLLIVSVHRTPGQVRLSVNARAPLLIDAERRTGAQYVFQSDSYKVQHMLG